MIPSLGRPRVTLVQATGSLHQTEHRVIMASTPIRTLTARFGGRSVQERRVAAVRIDLLFQRSNLVWRSPDISVTQHNCWRSHGEPL